MPHDKVTQQQLHAIRGKIIKIELEIDDLMDERAKYEKKIKQIDAKISELNKQIVVLRRAL